MEQISDLVKSYFKAYEMKEKEALNNLLREDFTFSSPVDKQINRDVYFERCWPSSRDIHTYHIQNLFTDENEAVIRYECELNSGVTFQNMEFFRFAGNKIKDIVVYFGFDTKQDTFVHEVARKFRESFAVGDADYIIENINNDVEWYTIGEKNLQGKEAVTKMFEPMRGVAPKEYHTKTILTDGNKAVIEGTMKMPNKSGEEALYAFCDMYTFDPSNRNKIQAVTAYIIEVPSEGNR